jgi:hypothetical protein
MRGVNGGGAISVMTRRSYKHFYLVLNELFETHGTDPGAAAMATRDDALNHRLQLLLLHECAAVLAGRYFAAKHPRSKNPARLFVTNWLDRTSVRELLEWSHAEAARRPPARSVSKKRQKYAGGLTVK